VQNPLPDVTALTRAERQQLLRDILAANAPAGRLRDGRQLITRVRRWLLVLAIGSIVVLLPWTLSLFFSLPSRYQAANWPLAWIGFDLGLLCSFLLTAWLAWRRSPLTQYPAVATGVLLLCDAWFDVTLSRGDDLIEAVLTALALELPVGIALIVLGTRPGRTLWGRASRRR
jgi:hypothetical protein